MAKNKRIPVIRFSGFDQEWDKKQFDAVFDMLSNNTLSRDNLNYVGGSTQNVHYGDILTVFGEYVDSDKEQLPFFNDEETTIKFQNALLKDGDIVFADTAEDEAVGKCIEICNVGDRKILSGLHTIPCRPKEQFASKYMGYYLNSDAYHQKLLPLMQGVKVIAISKTGIRGTELILTDDKEEQAKIGEFLSQLDEKIKYSEEKIRKMKIFKQSMFIKMFPKEGKKVPDIRFEGFSEDWEQHKVGELLIERNEQAPMSEEYSLMAFIANEGVAPKGDRYDRSALVSDTDNKKYKKTEKNDFIYSSNNLETGSIGLNKYGNATISPVYSIFYTTEIADADFIGRRFVRKDFINSMVKWRQGVVYGQWRIHESDFLQIEVMVPSLEEQRKIGAYLNNLDNLITSYQNELEKLKSIKSACMKRMFV